MYVSTVTSMQQFVVTTTRCLLPTQTQPSQHWAALWRLIANRRQVFSEQKTSNYHFDRYRPLETSSQTHLAKTQVSFWRGNLSPAAEFDFLRECARVAVNIVIGVIVLVV